MSEYSEFLPKILKLRVGAIDLDVEEYTIAKRDAMLKFILSGLDVATIVKPFWDAARIKDGAEVDLLSIIRQLKDVIIRVLGNDLTVVSCVTLDTPSNRKKVAVHLGDPNVEKTETNAEFGYSFSAKFFAWVKENLTVRQEFKLFEDLLTINDFVGLIKNYMSLASVTMVAAREKKEETKA
jgi:hypothetical protein